MLCCTIAPLQTFTSCNEFKTTPLALFADATDQRTPTTSAAAPLATHRVQGEFQGGKAVLSGRKLQSTDIFGQNSRNTRQFFSGFTYPLELSVDRIAEFN